MESLLVRHFGKPRVLLPVVHPIHREAALASVETAVKAGADGVFLINQGMWDDEVLALVPEVAERFAGLWIGINLLGWRPPKIIDRVSELPIKGIWSDTDEPARETDAQRAWPGLTFGGAAFKYQREVLDSELGAEALRVAQGVEVVTTSGPGTGMAASGEKVAAMKAALGPRPLGLASGVTPENVATFLPYVDAYLVATGIERELGVLDPERTRELARRIHEG